VSSFNNNDGNDLVNAADLEMFVRTELLANNNLSNQNSNTTNWLDQQKPTTIDLTYNDYGPEQRQHQNNVVDDSALVNNQKNSNNKPTTEVLNGYGPQGGHELNPDDLFELLAQAAEDGGASSKENHHQQQQLFKTNAIMHINASEKFLNSSKLSQDYSDELVEQWGLEDMCANLIRDMNQYGVCVLDNFLGNEKGLKVLDEVTGMHSAGVFKVD
jgi:hypothetical protein